MKERTINIFRILVLTALAIILVNACYYNVQKEDYYLDEKYSFFAANANLFSLKNVFRELKDSDYDINQVAAQETSKILSEKGIRYTLDEVNALMDAQKGDKFTVVNTLILDVFDSHPPLYYLLFNVVDSSIGGITLKWAGFLINIVALLVASFFIYRIAELLCGQYCAILATLFYGLSFDFINNATYFRMYALLTMWFTILTYLYIKWFRQGGSFENKVLLRWICLVECLAMLTQFFAALFIIPLFIITVVLLRAKGKSVKNYLMNQIWTALVYFLVWPASIYQLIFNQRSADVRNAAFITGLPMRIVSYAKLLKNSIFAGNKYFYVFAIAAIVFFLATMAFVTYKNGELKDLIHSDAFVYCTYIWGPAAFYYIVVADISPWVDARYMMPVVPYISLIVVISLWKLLAMIIRQKWVSIASITGLIILSYVLMRELDPYYLYPTTDEKMDYKARYEDNEAIVIDPSYESEYVDVFISNNHPYFTLVTDANLDEFIENSLSTENSYVFYINYLCNIEEVQRVIEDHGFNIARTDFQRGCYQAFAYER